MHPLQQEDLHCQDESNLVRHGARDASLRLTLAGSSLDWPGCRDLLWPVYGFPAFFPFERL